MSAAMLTDAELVARTRQGDAQAFESLVGRHYDAAFAVALARTGRREDAEDACQDAFIRALEQLEGCRQPDRFRAWLLRIVRNRAHNIRRHHALRSGEPLEDARIAADHAHAPDLAAERAEIRERMLLAMKELTEIQREILLLHDMEGWRHREIGEVLGMSAESSRVHLYNARRVMRDRLRSASDPLDPT